MSLLANTTYANPTTPFWIGKIEAGNGISVLGEDNQPIIQNDGLYTASGGIGISVSGGQDVQIDNTGVLSVSAGTGISVSAGQDPVITNNGILSISGGTSIGIGGTAQNPIINNPDFFRKNYEDSRSITNQTSTPEIVVFTQNFMLNANTTYLHTFSFNNSPISATAGTPTYYVISRILPQGVGFPGLVSNLLIQNQNSVWSDGRTGTFTSTGASNYTYELRVNVTAGTLNLRNLQTKIYRVS